MIISLEEAKTHLRIEHDEEDEYLTGLIRSSVPPSTSGIRTPAKRSSACSGTR